MELDGDFHDPKFKGYLLVHEPADHKLHHLLFAGSQGLLKRRRRL